jgi:hypothetical protein
MINGRLSIEQSFHTVLQECQYLVHASYVSRDDCFATVFLNRCTAGKC